MDRRLKKRLMLGVAAIAVVAGVTAAVVIAAQPPAHHRRVTAAVMAARHRRVTALATAAGYLGLSQTQLRGELHAGKSLAQIAEASGGKSVSGLIDALVAAKHTAIDAALKAGAITRAQSDRLLSRLTARMTARAHRS